MTNRDVALRSFFSYSTPGSSSSSPTSTSKARSAGDQGTYSFVYFHVIMRVVGQGLGIAFILMSWDDFSSRLNVLIAYLVFNAEGYFSLILCAYRFLIVGETSHLGTSIIDPKLPKGLSWREQLRTSPMVAVDWILLGANAIIIAGGSMLSEGLKQDPDLKKAATGKSLRVAGTALFLVLVQVFGAFAVLDLRKMKGDRNLLAILLTWPFLTIRGVYSIGSVEIPAYSYYSPETYTSTGMSSKFLVGEYVLGTTMEWCACGLLLSTYFSTAVGGETRVEANGEVNLGRGEELRERIKGEEV